MPKTSELGKYGERKKTVRCIINVGIKRKALKNADLKSAINVNTLGQKRGCRKCLIWVNSGV